MLYLCRLRKRSVLFLLIIFVSYAGFSQTQLEKLWNAAKKNSVDLLSAEYSFDYANFEYKKRSSLFPFSLKSSVNSSFSDSFESVTWYPSSARASATLTKQNPFGNSITATVSYGVDRGILNYFAENIGRDEIGYSHSPSFDLSIEQSLMPAFGDCGEKSIPQISLLKENIKTAGYLKDAAEKALVQSVTNYYIQARCTERELQKYKKYLEFYDKKIEAVSELLASSKISVSELWTLENKKWEYYKNYIDALNSRESIALALRNLCGESEEISITDDSLPQNDTGLLDYNPEKEKIVSAIESLKLNNSIRIQNSAPSLSLGGSFSENTKTNHDFAVNFIDDKSTLNWSFSVGFNFSDFLSPSRKLQKELFQNNLSVYEERLKELEEQSENQKNNYDGLIETYSKQVNKFAEIKKNREKLYNDYKVLYQKGKCSKLDLEEVGLNVTEAESIYDSLCDYLWLYKWMRVQCR